MSGVVKKKPNMVMARRATPEEEAQVANWLEGLGEGDPEDFIERRLEKLPEGRVKALIYERLNNWRSDVKALRAIRRGTIMMDMFSNDSQIRQEAVRLAQAEERLETAKASDVPMPSQPAAVKKIEEIEAGIDDTTDDEKNDA